MNETKTKLPPVVKVLLVTAFTTALIVGFGEYLFWIKPLSDQLVESTKEVAILKQTIQDMTRANIPLVLKTYTNTEFGFSFDYPKDYEVVEVPQGTEVPTEAFIYVRKKDDTSNTGAAWIAVRKTSDALVLETEFPDKVVKAETNVGADKISATSLSLLPGRGSEFGASLHILHMIVPLKKDSSQSLVLTNIGDVDLETFHAVLDSLQVI